MTQFHNTLSGKLEEFKPLREGEVKIYTCGPTVYDFAHIGNFRAFVFEDLLRRFLEFKDYKVTHVMNLTDVDDKTIAGAAREEKKLDDFTATYIQAFQEDLKTLNILPPTTQPRATREIDCSNGIIELIKTLIDKGAAYESEGSVYYRVASFPSYGKLSKKKLEQNITGARVDIDQYEKEECSDFALWKKSKEGEPSWDSPWGKGRPGWHIECSAMSMKYLGEQFDIHAGGEDLVFPHHENEIAQSEGATDKVPFVKYWLHCKFLLVNGEKMSKSKGNFFTLRDLLAKGYDPMAIRYALLSVHYRQPLNFTLEGLKDAGEIIKKLDDCYFQCLSRSYFESKDGYDAEAMKAMLKHYSEIMVEWLENDLNIAACIAGFLEGVSDINASLDKMDHQTLNDCISFFKKADQLLGLDITSVQLIDQNTLEKLKQLHEFRKVKNFQEADRLRLELKSLDWLVKDGRPGEPSTVKKKQRTWDK